MSDAIADVTLHLDEDTTHDEREKIRDKLLALDGVVAAAYHDERPHLIVIGYDPEIINSIEFVKTAKNSGYHAELVGI